MSNILGDSIRLNQPDIDFIVFVIDGYDQAVAHCESKYNHIYVRDLAIENLNDLTFKYDLTEFCTAIKPKCFEYVFSKGFAKAIYLDPDIYVFSSINSILNELNEHPICLAPHIIYPEVNYSGHWPQGRILAAGVYNLGFVGICNTERSALFLKWWNVNLDKYCFNERSEGYFTDQKWMNFCPIYFPETLIMRDMGVDVAFWNIHEREIVKSNGSYFVKRRNSENKELTPLKFFHFSNLKFRNAANFEHFIPFSFAGIPDVIEIVEFYGKKLIESDFALYNKVPNYKYNYFENGIHINKMHRRFYRRLLDNGIKYENPFSVGEASFFSILKKNHLISNDRDNCDNVLVRSQNNSSLKFNIVKFVLRMTVKLIGFKNYNFLCRFMLWLTKYENQLFLVKDYDKLVSAEKPDAYININK